jgi:hypothetical protein
MSYLETLEPRFKHDCTACRFLYQDGDMDIYWCAGATAMTELSGGSVIARWSDDPPEYSSSPVSIILYSESESKYGTALRRAVAYLSQKSLIGVHVNQKYLDDWDEMRALDQ